MSTLSSSALAIRRVARVWSVASIAFVLILAIAEVFSVQGATPTAEELVALLLWPIGVLIGLILCWTREALGGAIATGCLIAFYFWNLILDGRIPREPFFLLVAAPGVLFLIAWLLSHSDISPSAPGHGWGTSHHAIR